MNKFLVVAVVVVAALAVAAILWAFLGDVGPSPKPAPVESTPSTETPHDDPSTDVREPGEPQPVGLEVDVRRGGKRVDGEVSLWIAGGTDKASFSEGPWTERRLPDQPSGRYAVVASAGGDVGVSKTFEYEAGEPRRVRVELRPSAIVDGRVNAAGKGAADASVHVETGKFDVIVASGASGPLEEELTTLVAGLATDATSKDGGRFDLEHCPTGHVVFGADGEAGHGAAKFDVKAPRTTGVVIELTFESSVHGTVRFWDGVPTDGGLFELRAGEGEGVSFTTGSDGTYRIPRLKPGQYRAALISEAGSHLVPNAVLELGPGEDAEFSFSAGIVVVEGIVKRDGKPAGGVQVVFFDDEERETAMTDVDGRYTLEVHRAGEYQAQLEGREPFRTLVANDHRCTLDFVILP